ncbi:RHS repeat-associated core domain-containing protein [Rheinheimera sediminis]|uniref:hypothetical protein n=1 Tax=Rheinheimera sp. YQF-1 TaxID=2499626 RepID=UPI0016453FCE|nr:hypothetical protein [Rheinheimera sp. YQF-1]
MQADPFIQAPGNLQNYNRYSYVLNNPMSMTDPSGYFSLGKLFNPLKSIVRAVLSVIPQNVGNFLIGIGSKFCGPWAGACAAAATYEFSRAHGMSRSGALRAAAAAGIAAYAFGKIGEYYSDAGIDNIVAGAENGGDFSGLTSFGGNALTAGQVAGQVTAHAAVGGIVSSIGGGKFGHGFFSAGVTKGLGTPISDTYGQGAIGGTITSMVIGGTASVIAGDKFANGAMTAAYQALFNQFSKWAYEYQYKKATLRQFMHGRDMIGEVLDTEKEAALKSHYPSDVDAVIIHGSTNGKLLGPGGEISIKDFHSLYETYFKQSSRAILLLSCHAGTSANAQILANLTGRMVIAPSVGQALFSSGSGYSYGVEKGAYLQEFKPVKGN